MNTATAPIRQANAENANAELLRELRHAHQIILNAIRVMTLDQRLEWGEANVRDGVIVDGDGISRFHEREALFKKVEAASEVPQ